MTKPRNILLVAILNLVVGLYDFVVGILDIVTGHTVWGVILLAAGICLFYLTYILFKLYIRESKV